MNKNEFVKVLAKNANLPQEKTKELLNTMLGTIIEVVKSEEKLSLTGFGSFYVSNRSKRKGRNPATGKAITIPAFKLPVFQRGKLFKKTLNEQPKPQKQSRSAKKN